MESNNMPSVTHQRTNAASMQNPTLRMGQLPPEMRQAMNYHFASLGGPWPPHIGLPGALPHTGNPFWQSPTPSHPNFHPQVPQHQMPHFMTPQVQHMIAHQQQMRAAMGAHGAGDHNALPNISPSFGNHNASGEQQLPAPLAQPILPSNGAPTHTIIQEGQAPNGGHWRMVINGPAVQIPTVSFGNHGHVQTQQIPTPTQTNVHEMNGPLPGIHPGEQLANPTIVPQSSSPTAQTSWQVSLQDLSGRMSQLEAAMANGVTPSEDAIWQTQVAYHNHLREQPSLQGRLQIPLNLRFTELMARIASRTRAAAHSGTSRPVQQTAINPTGVSTLAPHSPSSAMTATTVYLLSSPQGPQALLVSPQGRYITPGLNIGTNTLRPVQGNGDPNPTQNPSVNPPNPTNERRRVVRVANHGRVDAVQGARPDAARDLVRILLPLGGHLWLLLRLFGFVWFFMGGADWRRTFLVLAAAIVVFLSQTAAFRPLVEAVWEPIRRHVENLVPLATENPAQNPGVGVRAEGQGRPENERPPESIPRPEDLAARLQRERDDRDQGLLNRSLRRAERATVLFIASLVPGVGERHIAARDAAVAARQAAEREQEEQRRRHEELVQREQAAGPLTVEQESTGETQGSNHSNESIQLPAIET